MHISVTKSDYHKYLYHHSPVSKVSGYYYYNLPEAVSPWDVVCGK